MSSLVVLSSPPPSPFSTPTKGSPWLLILFSLLGVVGPAALAQPDIEVTPEDLRLEVETRFFVVDTLFVTNAGDSLLLIDVATEIEDFPLPPDYRARQAPGLYERDLRLAGTYDTDLQRLLSQADSNGPVRVIVQLNVPFAPEGYLRSGDAAAQRAEIQARQDEVLEALAGTQTELLHRYDYVPSLALRVGSEGLRRLAAHPGVVHIAEDRLEAPHLEESTVIVGAPAAWDLGFSGLGRAVAILDTGVDNDHPFLAEKIVAEACFSSGTSLCPGGAAEEIGPGAGDDACELDPNISGCDHGTHVAGIAAGRTDGFYGVARDAGIIALQVFSRVDSQEQCGSNPAPCALAFQSDIIAALEFVFDLTVEIDVASANMSLGGGFFTAPCPGDPREAISAQLTSVGVAVVSSSGNGGRSNGMSAPACAPSIISVASTGDGSFGAAVDRVSSFSDVASFTDFFAPGDRIRSSVPGAQYANLLGTSMAAPHVAGAFAILEEADPEIGVDQASGALMVSGLPITDTRNDVTLPRIQIDFALSALEWLGVVAEEVAVEAGETVAVPVFANALPLRPGEYAGSVVISSNDPDQPAVTVPVTLTVMPPAPIGLQVQSRNPESGALFVTQPDDLNGEGVGTTPGLRVYPRGASVTLAAAPSAADNTFAYWVHDGEIVLARSVTFRLDEPALWTATYVPPDNAAPVANPDSAFTPQGQGVEINVLANDSDPEGGPLVVAGLAGTVNGVANILENQNIDYVPDPDFVGVDTFTYFAADEFGALGEAEVSVFVGVDVGTESGSTLPTAFTVRGSYPNPSGGAARLRFDLPAAAHVAVTVYDLLGREVLRVAPRMAAAGFDRTVPLNAKALPAGVYIYRMTAATPEELYTGSGRFTVMR